MHWRLAALSLPLAFACGQLHGQITVTYTAEVNDGFTSPTAPVRRPDFQSYFDTILAPGYAFNRPSGRALLFDEVAGVNGVPTNSVFGYSFDALPTGIVAATLEIRLRGGQVATHTDELQFQFVEANQSLWTLSTLYRVEINVLNGARWNPGDERVFTLDLAALPSGPGTSGPSNLRSSMNTEGYLDVLYHDDGGVDNMILTLTIDPDAACIGDADRNRFRNFADITAVLLNYGQSFAAGTGIGDADIDGDVDSSDVSAVLMNYGLPCF